MDKEYAIDFFGKNDREELGVGRIKSEAVSQAKYYLRKGATEMILKLYQDGDLLHQWDWRGGKWCQYE